jgi:hypothetical protein
MWVENFDETTSWSIEENNAKGSLMEIMIILIE